MRNILILSSALSKKYYIAPRLNLEEFNWGSNSIFMPEKSESDFVYEQAVNSVLII